MPGAGDLTVRAVGWPHIYLSAGLMQEELWVISGESGVVEEGGLRVAGRGCLGVLRVAVLMREMDGDVGMVVIKMHHKRSFCVREGRNLILSNMMSKEEVYKPVVLKGI